MLKSKNIYFCFFVAPLFFITASYGSYNTYDPLILRSEPYVLNTDFFDVYYKLTECYSGALKLTENAQGENQLIDLQIETYKSIKNIFFEIEKRASRIDQNPTQYAVVLLKFNPLRLALEHGDGEFISYLMIAKGRWIDQFKIRWINDILFGEPLQYIIDRKSIKKVFALLIDWIESYGLYQDPLHASMLVYRVGLWQLCKQEVQKLKDAQKKIIT